VTRCYFFFAAVFFAAGFFAAFLAVVFLAAGFFAAAIPLHLFSFQNEILCCAHRKNKIFALVKQKMKKIVSLEVNRC
jgi:energy-coupling factor transporter transmembrane protein EcfT